MSGNHHVRSHTKRRIRVALTLLGLVMVGFAPMAPANAATTITLSRGTVIGGESISVRGTLGQRKARPVVLQRKSGTSWVKVLGSKSTSTGAFRFTYKPPTQAGARTVIRVIAPRARISGKTYSQIVTGSRTVLTVGQTATITAPQLVSQGSGFTVTGRFTPARPGRTVGLQQLVNGVWNGVLTLLPQNSAGTVSFSVPGLAVGTYQYRVITLASAGAPALASAAAFVSVTMPVPTGLTATPGNESVQLSWNAVTADGLDGYVVYQSTDPEVSAASWNQVAQVTGTSHQVSGLNPTQTYYFSVRSINGTGAKSAFAPKVSAKPLDSTAPPVPSGVTATPGNTTVQVSWSAVAAADLGGYKLYQGTSASGPWTPAGGTTIPAGTTTHPVTGLTNGTEYFFAVASFDTTTPTPNESLKSTAVSATPAVGADTTPPPVPSGVTATSGNTTAQVSWSAVDAGDLAGYNLYQGLSASGPWTKVNGSPIAVGTTTYPVTGLTNGTEYFFAVTSLDTNIPTANESAKSNPPASATPAAPPSGWTAVSTGLQHTCALGTNGTLWCWGLNRHGQLGNSTGTETGNAYATPSRVGSATTWTSVSAGDDFTCGIQSPGTLWCWGRNTYGQLGNATHADTDLPSAAPVQVGSATNWTSVSAGANAACAIQSTGTLWCWGLNYNGQIARAANVDTLTPNPDAVQVGALTTWSSVSSGTDHACARRTDGTVWCWGSNLYGQLGNAGPTMGTFTSTTTPTQVGAATTWTSVSAGEYHSCGIQSGGAALCWGTNVYGELGSAANADANGTPTAAGTGWTSISAGGDHTCGTKADGVYCFGRNQDGQLGKTANTTANATAAKVSVSTSAWTSVDSGAASTCARTTANKVFCWGFNEYGQLGNPATIGTAPNKDPFDVLVPAG